MNRKVILLDVALVALAAALGWQIRQRWLDELARERAIFTNAARKMNVLPPPPIAPAKPVPAMEYIDVAQKTLFSPDRNPNVVIEPPAPKPKPPMPPLPAYFGQMAFGEPVVLLSEKAGEQKSYHVGDKAGPFEIAAFNSETITLIWDGQSIERKLEDLKPKEAAPPQPPAGRPAVQPAPGSTLKTLGATSGEGDSKKDTGLLGVDVGGGFYGCIAGDSTPNGGIVNGYKKVITRGLFGETCHWELVK